jgi:hypothetical protein
MENKTSRSRSAVKQKGMVFGFWKTATAVVGPEIVVVVVGSTNTNSLEKVAGFKSWIDSISIDSVSHLQR